MSNIVNKVKDAITGHKDHDTTTGTHTNTTGSDPNYYSSGNTGPHSTNVANKLDPRVDSDRDGSRTVGTGNTYGSTTGNTYGSTTGDTYGSHTGMGTGASHGPHDSGLANRVDPRIDSSTGTTNTGYTMGGTGAGFSHSSTAGPHSSNVANKMDPRVDSDMDGSRTYGNTGTYGSNTGSTGMMGSTGTHNTTAGPHKSDMANKLDPRVDSDLDGSRTVGGGQSYGNY